MKTKQGNYVSSDIQEFPDLRTVRKTPAGGFGKGPFAIVIAEDKRETSATLHHVLQLGFRKVFLVAPQGLTLDPEMEMFAEKLVLIRDRTRRPDAAQDAVNSLMDILAGEWIHYCFNGEFLFYPFCEDRTIAEVATFITEERRRSALTYVIDLYAGDLHTFPDAVSLDNALLDGSGYYAEPRRDANDVDMDRQMNFYGGLRWRFEEHVDDSKRKIDRVGLFRAETGLRLRDNHTLSDEEMNTFACPWHHSLTATICSFRVAKALRSNPGSRDDIHDFRWHRSERFQWSSQQLMDLGLMEPGQWF